MKLHIYAQYCEHMPAAIVGDRETLEKLVETIIKVLESEGEPKNIFVHNQVKAFAADGEGYEVKVEMNNDPNYWENCSLPYKTWVDPSAKIK